MLLLLCVECVLLVKREEIEEHSLSFVDKVVVIVTFVIVSFALSFGVGREKGDATDGRRKMMQVLLPRSWTLQDRPEIEPAKSKHLPTHHRILV